MQLPRLHILIVCLVCATAVAADWPQHQHDARRSGFTAEEIAPPYRLAWRHEFWPETVAGRVQAIVYRGHVIIPTQQGAVHAFDARTGKPAWKWTGGAGPIVHSVACADGRVFFACLEGRVYALDADTGELAWEVKTNSGFSVTPLLLGDRLFLGNRRGEFLALSQSDGSILWTHRIGAPILNSAAASDDGQTASVYFGGEDMRVYAFNAATGQRLWVTDQLPGLSMKDYHPVVHKGHVIVRPMASFQADIYAEAGPYGPFPNNLPGGWQASWKRDEVKQRVAEAMAIEVGKMPQDLLDRQQAVVEHFRKYPLEQDMFVLDAATGRSAKIPPHFRMQSQHGPVTPVVEDLDGYLIVPWVHGTFGWARYDIAKNQLVQFILPPHPTNSDETLNVSCGGRHVYVFHCQEGNASRTGVFDLTGRRWLDNPSPQVTWYDNLQSGANPVSIGEGHCFHLLFNTLVARTTGQAEEK